ncbi:hypothetical protein FPV67DRAFT_1678620 [Lyophyllum atratum]|nr:hypothetical protein FPV67DRAFT_1678620 [Lyophyllum atratum]
MDPSTPTSVQAANRARRASARAATREALSSPIRNSPRHSALLTPPSTIRTYASRRKRTHRPDSALASIRVDLFGSGAASSSGAHPSPSAINNPVLTAERPEVAQITDELQNKRSGLEGLPLAKVEDALEPTQRDLKRIEDNSLVEVSFNAITVPMPYLQSTCNATIHSLEKKLRSLKALKDANTDLFDTSLVPKSIEHFQNTLDGFQFIGISHWKYFRYDCPLCAAPVSTSPVDTAEFKTFISAAWKALAPFPGLLPSLEDMVDESDVKFGLKYFFGLFLDTLDYAEQERAKAH